MDSDKILVMDAGRCVEFGSPYELLTKQDGPLVFKGMVEQTGKSNYQQFFETAEKVRNPIISCDQISNILKFTESRGSKDTFVN